MMRLLPCVYHRNMFIIDFFSFLKESLVTYSLNAFFVYVFYSKQAD